MITKVQKWGNSLAIRIPKPFATDLGIEDTSEVNLVLEDGKLIVSKAEAVSFSLENLLAEITADNIHDEVDFGTAEGNEVW